MFRWILLLAWMANPSAILASESYETFQREKVQEFVTSFGNSIKTNFLAPNQLKQKESLSFLQQHTKAGLDFLIAIQDIRSTEGDDNPMFDKVFLRQSEDLAIDGLVNLHIGITYQAKNLRWPTKYLEKANKIYFDLIYQTFMKRWGQVYLMNQDLFEAPPFRVNLNTVNPDLGKVKKIMAYAAKNDPLLFAYHRLIYELEQNLSEHTGESIKDLSFIRNNSLLLLSALGYFAATAPSAESISIFAAASLAALNAKKIFSMFNPAPNVVDSLKSFVKALTTPDNVQYAFKRATACYNLF